jgi:hypothetical protein
VLAGFGYGGREHGTRCGVDYPRNLAHGSINVDCCYISLCGQGDGQ